MSAIEDIAAERNRQIEAEGWTPEHDDAHQFGELARAGAQYAILAAWPDQAERSVMSGDNGHAVPFDATHLHGRRETMIWPWDAEWLKPTTPRRDLVKAGALIVAEIERIDRAAARESE